MYLDYEWQWHDYCSDSEHSSDTPPPPECNPGYQWTEREWTLRYERELREIWKKLIEYGEKHLGGSFMQLTSYESWAALVFHQTVI